MVRDADFTQERVVGGRVEKEREHAAVLVDRVDTKWPPSDETVYGGGVGHVVDRGARFTV